MPIGLLHDIAKDCPRGVRLLGIDVGEKTLGLALGDLEQGIATPLKTLMRTSFSRDMSVLAEVVHDYEIGGFIIGLPLNMDGTEGRRAQSVRDFAAEMARHPEVVGPSPWVALFDERLSTDSVERLVEGSVDISKRQAKSKGLIDALAARLILQNALDILVKL
jgi:putative holliday junction resolvase